MARRYTLESLGLNSIDYVPDAHVSLDYQGAPTASELEDEILSGIHTNPDGSVGCLLCGCVDMFYREFNTKGRRYRCNSCFYNSESQFESVKSKKDITLSSYGLVYVCDICGEEMDSYNKATVLRHIKKHEDDNKVSEAEYYFNPYSGQGGHYNRNTDTVNINLSNRGGELFNELYDNLAHEYGHKVTTEDTYTPYEREFAAFMVETGGDWERSKILTFLQPRTHVEIISKMPSENGWVSDDTLNEYFATLDIESNQDTLKYAEHLVKHPEYPEYSKQFIAHFLDYANKSFEAEGYGLWTQAQLDAPDAPWTPEVISPVFPLKGYEKPVEVVRAELQKHIVGKEIRMWHDSHDPGFYYDFGFSEPQSPGTMGKVTGISEVNPNRPWVIGVWVTIISGGSENHPIGSRVWFHVKDANFPGSLYKGWHEGDYMAEGEEALYWATRTNMLDAEDYEILRWIKVLRDEDPEDWDDIDWEDEIPDEDDWHDEIDWRAENYFQYPQHRNKTFSAEYPKPKSPWDAISPENYEKMIQAYAKKREQWDYEDTKPSKNYANYMTSPQGNPQRIANRKRLNTGGLFLNWLKTFNVGIAGYKRQCEFFHIKPVPAKSQTRASDRDPMNPYRKHPWDNTPQKPQPYPWQQPPWGTNPSDYEKKYPREYEK